MIKPHRDLRRIVVELRHILNLASPSGLALASRVVRVKAFYGPHQRTHYPLLAR